MGALASANLESKVGGRPMFLNLKEKKSGWVVGWLASDDEFDGGICKLDDVEVGEKPFMNCS